MGTFHDAARAYAKHGWPVFPLVAKSKHPLVEHGFKDATVDLAQIDEWWRKHPNANVALRTGDVFDVLDLDGPEAADKFRAWCDEHSVDPATIRRAVSRTSKGWHYLFRASGIGNRSKLLGAPIDWRGTGGYIVAPPSIHPSGAIYRWVVHLNGALPDVPDALRLVLAPPAPKPLPPATNTITSTPYLEAGYRGELDKLRQATEGERNTRLFDGLCKMYTLVNSGLPATAIDDMCNIARGLGLGDTEIERTRASAQQTVGDQVRVPALRPAPAAPMTPAYTRPQVPDMPARASSVAPDDAAYQGLIGEIVRQLAPYTEADPVGILATLLAATGCAVGRAPHALVATTRHPLLIWPLLLGRTASGRKGTAYDVAESVLRQADPVFAAGNITGGLSSGEGLIHAVRDPTYDVPDDPAKEPRVTDPGVEDKRRLIVESEFGGTMARARREGSSLSAVLRQAWDGKTLSILTKTAVTATGAHIAITGHVTPREFLLRLRDTDVAGGTYNRFLPLLVTRAHLLPEAPSPPADLLEDLGRELRQRIVKARTVTTISREPAVAAHWRDVYHELSATEETDTDSDRLGQFIARAVPYTIRLAALYAVLDGQRAVAAPHIDAAAALVRYSIGSVREILHTPGDARADKLTEALAEAGPAGLTRTEVAAIFGRNLTAPELDSVLRLIPGLEATQEHRETTGRPITRYVLPAVADGNEKNEITK